MPHRVTVIGLGVMGQRMLGNMAAHAQFEVATAWDPDAAACAATTSRFPGIRIAASADQAIADPDTEVVYIASPPALHAAHAIAALDAGKAVYCEKPLAVDLAEGRGLVGRAETSPKAAIVNFSLASAAATREIERSLAADEVGAIAGIDVRIQFSQWPREWQMGAVGWLSRRAQGGFTREVVSHWIYLTERLFGVTRLRAASVRWPEGDGSELQMIADLDAGGIPVSIAGGVGGVGPDRVEYTIRGSRRSWRIHDWNRLRTATGPQWQEALTHLADPRQTGYVLQLDNAAAAFSGAEHSMPGFAQALSVQERVEAILASD